MFELSEYGAFAMVVSRVTLVAIVARICHRPLTKLADIFRALLLARVAQLDGSSPNSIFLAILSANPKGLSCRLHRDGQTRSGQSLKADIEDSMLRSSG